MAARLYKRSFICLLCLTLFSCTRFRSAPAELPVLVVNGEKFSAGDFSKQLAKKLKTFDALAAKDPTNIKRTKEMILNEFIIATLLRQQAITKGLSVSDEEFEKEFDRVRKSYPDDLTFKAALAEEGASLADWSAHLRQSLLEKKAFTVIGPEIKETQLLEEAKEYYSSHKNEFQRPAQVHIKQIVVAKLDDAERIHHSLKTGASFEELAKKYSISPDASNGGDIGFISKGVVPAFDTAFNLRPGQLSGVVKSSYGFHILKLVDKRSAMLLTFDQAKDRILPRLLSKKQQESFNLWLENAIRSAKIERNDVLLNKLTVRTEGTQE